FVVQYAVTDATHTCDPRDPRFTDVGNWRPLATHFGYPQPSNQPIDFTFAARTLGCVRLFGAELSQDDYGNRFLQLADVTVLDGQRALTLREAAASSTWADWSVARLHDGSPQSAWSSGIHTEHLASSEWAAVVLTQPTQVDRVRLVPRAGPDNLSLGFPKDFVLQYAVSDATHTCDPRDPRFTDVGNWRPLVTRFGYPQPSNQPIEFTFTPRTLGCVRLFGAELSQDDYGNRFLQLADVTVLVGQRTLALREAAASSTWADWSVARLLDGSPHTAWSSGVHTEHLASSEWAAVVLAQPTQVDQVRLSPRAGLDDRSLGFPQDFVLQYAVTDATHTCDPRDPRFTEVGNWRPLITRFGYPQPSNQPITFAITPRTLGCVRLLGTELSQDDYGNRFLQLAEIDLLTR
ncbi:MAG: discoidin domain-containing protein, partial [Chloroflexia bacterium]|nr:discoidin domain-containing protein [Chloroflexia bacterium]